MATLLGVGKEAGPIITSANEKGSDTFLQPCVSLRRDIQWHHLSIVNNKKIQ